mgnify:CR=1 FL=1
MTSMFKTKNTAKKKNKEEEKGKSLPSTPFILSSVLHHPIF